MNIGIVVYSKTGNTLSVSEKLAKKLETSGHKVRIERITVADDEELELEKVRFTSLPKPEGYDALVVAGPVQAFSLCRIMKAYLPKLPELDGKK
jgi:flavodoxin